MSSEVCIDLEQNKQSVPERGTGEIQLTGEGSDISQKEPVSEESGEMDIPEGQILVHGNTGPYLMNKDKWPNLGKSSEKISTANMNGHEGGKYLDVDSGKDSDIEGLTQEESLMEKMDFSHGEGDSDDDSNIPWVVSGSKKKNKKLQKGKVVIATRTSTRAVKDGRTMMEKAMERAQSKDVITEGNQSKNQFLILNDLENEQIHSIASELDLRIEDIDTQVDIFKAEEKVRAALAEANYKEYLDRINKNTSPRGEEEFVLSWGH